MPDESVNFDRAAPFYDATRGFPEGVEEEIAQFIATTSTLDPSLSELLEIGVGTGRMAIPLLPYAKSITGVDISPNMLHVLISKKRDLALRPICASGLKLPFIKQSFDRVLLVHILHLIPDPLQVLREIERVLKPGGKILHGFNKQNKSHQNHLMAAWEKHRPERKIGTGWPDTNEVLKQSKWELERNSDFFYDRVQTVGQFLDVIQNRCWSSTWGLSDDEIAPGIEAMKTAAELHYHGNYDHLIHEEAIFRLQIYVQTSH